MNENGRLGVMLDCSRNGVRTVQALRKFIDLITAMGYDTLMLYTEDTYEIEGQPYFGYMRGRYSMEELKELDRYALSKGLELIPCIQTLAHLNGIVNWPAYAPFVDCNDILLAGDDRTYALIDDMFKTLEQCYTSRIVNIGLDEAHMCGLGKYLDINGFQDRHQIFVRHLERVREIAAKHGFHVIMWSDMFFRFQNNGGYQMTNPVVPDWLPDTVPQDVGLVYWDYYDWGNNEEHYNNMFDAHSKFKNEIWYAGGAWTWSGFSPRNYLSERVEKVAMPICMAHGVKNVLMTMWGDDGCVCSAFSAMPALYFASRLYHGSTDMDDIRAGFEAMFHIPYEEYKLLDLPGMVGGENGWLRNPEKYMLFSDPFLGMFDSTVVVDDAKEYADAAEKLAAWEKQPEWGDLFASEASLCRIMAEKYALGVKVRKAYREKDLRELAKCAVSCRKAAEETAVFCGKLRKVWMKENKPYGFETQEIRLGGLKCRLESCAARIEAYIAGEIDKIDELEETLLDAEGGETVLKQKPIYRNLWRDIATPNLL